MKKDIKVKVKRNTGLALVKGEEKDPSTYQVWLISGVQQFPVGVSRFSKREAYWYKKMLKQALGLK